MLTIRTGEVVSDLSKPCDFFLYWCSRELGRAVYYFVFRGLPVYLVGTLIFGLEYGTNWVMWPLFLVALALGAMSGVVYRVLLSLFAFWMLEARAVITLGTTLAQFFTGNYLPVAFFPAWLYTLTSWLPFNGMINAPTQIFLGKLGGSALLSELAVQLSIYHQFLQRLFVFIVPLAFGTYIPVCFILERALPFGLPNWLAFVSPLVALLFALVALAFWRFGVHRYQSTGS